MEKTRKDVGQKFRRIKHNLVNTSKKDDDDDMKNVNSLELRNQKVISAVSTYKRNVASTIRTGLREENVDKRRKKLDEYSLYMDLKEGSLELENHNTTCLHKVMGKIGQVTQLLAEEKVKRDMMIEQRVLDDLSPYQELEKSLGKSREKLANAFTDLDIARKAYEKSEPNNTQLMEGVDSCHLKLENQKDNTITDIYTLAAKEQEISKVFTALLEEQLEYHRLAMRTIEQVLPEIRKDIENARPRPIFGVDLTEHLRHTQERIATVLNKCCSLLRRNGVSEKGIFRVNGNNTKIRRMKAAFDAGQIKLDEPAYYLDPHSIASVLKSYLRELPDPLLTHALHHEWAQAARLEGEEKLQAIENCIVQLPPAHRDNLTYLIHFLDELLTYKNFTSMNASNLAIVFGPNLLPTEMDGNNALGTRIVETMLMNATRLFGCPTRETIEDIPSEMTTSTRSLNIDTTSRSSFKLDNTSPGYGASPRPRPKEKAPPPPSVLRTSDLIDLNDDCATSQMTGTQTTPPQPNHYYKQDMAQFAMDHSYHQEMNHEQDSPPDGNRRSPSMNSDDSFDDYPSDSLARQVPKRQPRRPPPPAIRSNSVSTSAPSRPTSYNMAVGVTPTTFEPIPSPRSRGTVHATVSADIAAKGIIRPTVMSDNNFGIGVSDASNRTVISVEAPPPPFRARPPLPAKPKTDEKETSRL